MKLRVSGKNFDIGDALRTQVETRLTALIDKYLEGRYTAAQVIFSKEGNSFRSDSFLQLPEGAALEATGNAHDAYAAFDHAISRMDTRLKRHRGRLKTRQIGRTPGEGSVSQMVVYEAPTHDVLPEEYHPVIIAESTTTLPHFTVPEAVAEFDLTGAPVLVFIHSGTNRVNVLYRRQDSAIGWIDTPSS